MEIHNVIPGGGTVYTSVSLTEASYKNGTPDMAFEYIPTGTTIRQELNVPAGECSINIYQDMNNNGKLDAGFLGIPKEPVGVSNWNGKGAPGNFNKRKITIDDATAIISVNMYQL